MVEMTMMTYFGNEINQEKCIQSYSRSATLLEIFSIQNFWHISNKI